MIDFEYHRATSLDDAVTSGASSSAKFIAGGTTLVDLMKLDVERPAHLIDINELRERPEALQRR